MNNKKLLSILLYIVCVLILTNLVLFIFHIVINYPKIMISVMLGGIVFVYLVLIYMAIQDILGSLSEKIINKFWRR